MLLEYKPPTEPYLDIIYQDEDILILNKPSGLLTVPGKAPEHKDSLDYRVRLVWPLARIVHRLDMATSGLVVMAMHAQSQRDLNKQFELRQTKKRYVALLEGNLTEQKGTVKLPIRLDLDDRPKQLVDFENGKNAETYWEIIQIEDDITRVYFYPITGRTHQLRVHAAHKNGLNAPIVGDDLYGKKGKRLHLHAEFIEFLHPKTMEKMSFLVAPEF